MPKIQNIYDNKHFYSKYKQMRDTNINANSLIEIPEIKKMLPDLNGKTILDLGCGYGEMARFFVKNGAAKVVGIDISKNMISEAEKHNRKNIEYLILPLEQLDKINQKFDVVFSSLALHYVKDFKKLAFDISNLLSKNGVLVFSQMHPACTAPILLNGVEKHLEIQGKNYYHFSDYNNLGLRLHSWNDKNVKFYHRNFETIINCLSDAGLNIVQIKEPSASKKAIKLVPKYVRLFDRPLFLFVKAKKNGENT